jgi:hypothetical protein
MKKKAKKEKEPLFVEDYLLTTIPNLFKTKYILEEEESYY